MVNRKGQRNSFTWTIQTVSNKLECLMSVTKRSKLKEAFGNFVDNRRSIQRDATVPLAMSGTNGGSKNVHLFAFAWRSSILFPFKVVVLFLPSFFLSFSLQHFVSERRVEVSESVRQMAETWAARLSASVASRALYYSTSPA